MSLDNNHCYIRELIESFNNHLNDFLLIIAWLKITVTLLKKVAIFGNFMVPKTVTTSLILVGTVSPKSRKQKFLQIVCSIILSIGGVVVEAAGWQPRSPWFDSWPNRFYKFTYKPWISMIIFLTNNWNIRKTALRTTQNIENQWMSVDKKSV